MSNKSLAEVVLKIKRGTKGIELAHIMLDAGIPVIVVGAGGTPKRRDWPNITIEQSRRELEHYVEGRDALALVGGHGIDIVDLDTKNDGVTIDDRPDFALHGTTLTPSGGFHFPVVSTGVGKMKLVRDDGVVIGDYIGGRPDGSGRGFAFLPGSTRESYPGKDYEIVEDIDLTDATPDEGLRRWLENMPPARNANGERIGGSEPLVPPNPGASVVEQEAALIADALARLDALPWPWHKGACWDEGTFRGAQDLQSIANADWTRYDPDAAYADFMAHAPYDKAWDERDAKWGRVKEEGYGNRYVRTPAQYDFWDLIEANGLDNLDEEPLTAYDRDVRREAERMRIQRDARALLDREKRGRHPIPDLVTLEDVQNEPEEDEAFLVDGLWPEDGNVILVAQYKAGKTTLNGNLIRSLVDGEPFLGEYKVQPGRRVVLIDDELSPRMVKSWLLDQRISNAADVSLMTLRGQLSTFDIMDETCRSEWAATIKGNDVLIFDCLRPALDALGLSEDKESGVFLNALEELAHEAGVREILVTHHMGHNGERTRGDSRLRDWPDATWQIVRESADDPRSTRYFSALGRDIDQPEQGLAYDAETRRLTVSGGSRREASVDRVKGDILDYIGEHPGQSGNTIKKEVGGDHNKVAEALKSLTESSLIRVEIEGQKHSHYLVADQDSDE